MDRLEELTGFRHRVTSAYHPQANGLDERLNQTLKAALQKLVNDNHDDWDQLIDNVLFAYRTSKQDSTKYTPFFLMYGREAKLPIDVELMKQPENGQTNLEDLDEKIAKLIDLQKRVHDRAYENIAKAQQRQKLQYDRKHNAGTNLKEGDKVLKQELRNEGRKGGKLDVQFTGPYRITKDLGKGRFALENMQGVPLKKTFNCHRLKLWLEPNKKCGTSTPDINLDINLSLSSILPLSPPSLSTSWSRKHSTPIKSDRNPDKHSTPTKSDRNPDKHSTPTKSDRNPDKHSTPTKSDRNPDTKRKPTEQPHCSQPHKRRKVS